MAYLYKVILHKVILLTLNTICFMYRIRDVSKDTKKSAPKKSIPRHFFKNIFNTGVFNIPIGGNRAGYLTNRL